jgi:hypothetical protein
MSLCSKSLPIQWFNTAAPDDRSDQFKSQRRQTMKIQFILLTSVCIVARCVAFVPSPVAPMRARLMMVVLEPELEGGKEMAPVSSSLANCRMKEMEEITGKNKDEEQVYKFWMTAEAEGSLIKEIRAQILKDAAKKANFPGFRKVCRRSTSFFILAD